MKMTTTTTTTTSAILIASAPQAEWQEMGTMTTDGRGE
jgi:hypothetical protein